MSPRLYQVGRQYRDTARLDDPSDEFLLWLNDGPEGGIGNTGGIRSLSFSSIKTPVPAALVLVTRTTPGQFSNPWEDVIDAATRQIVYWGDSRSDRPLPLGQSVGNKRLMASYAPIVDGQWALIPPVLHFSKTKQGYVQFNGLCIFQRLELSRFQDNGVRLWNLRAHLSVLDCDSMEVEWLGSRRAAEAVDNLPDIGPSPWREYLLAQRDLL